MAGRHIHVRVNSRTTFAVTVIIWTFGFLWLRTEAPAQAVYHDCPMQGNAKTARVQELDRLKNRDTAPTQIDPAITLKAILAPGNDEHRWKNSEGATIEGYVVEVLPGGIEAANYRARKWKYRDTHIALVLDPARRAPNKRMIVEVTPRCRAKMAAKGVD